MKKRGTTETLEPKGGAVLSQLNIVGTDGKSSGDNKNNMVDKKDKAMPPRIIEVSADGSFELPDNPVADPATVDFDDEPPCLDFPKGSVQETTASPSIMDEMLEAATAARQVVKEKAAAEEKRVKAEFGSGLKKGFFGDSSKPKKDISEVERHNLMCMSQSTLRIFFLIANIKFRSIFL